MVCASCFLRGFFPNRLLARPTTSLFLVEVAYSCQMSKSYKCCGGWLSARMGKETSAPFPLHDFCPPLERCCPPKFSKKNKRKNNRNNRLLFKKQLPTVFCPLLKIFSSRKPAEVVQSRNGTMHVSYLQSGHSQPHGKLKPKVISRQIPSNNEKTTQHVIY